MSQVDRVVGAEGGEVFGNCGLVDECDQGRGKMAGRGSKTGMVPYVQIRSYHTRHLLVKIQMEVIEGEGDRDANAETGK
jgi:hypothetical protein